MGREEWKNLIAWAFVIMVVAGIVVSESNDGGDGTDVSDYAAKENCKAAVTMYLRAPATAHFHDLSAAGITVTGSVDSQNGFGALLTSTFECKIDEHQWVVGEPVIIEH